MKKSQASLEYMWVYGIALLLIVLILAAFFSFGVFSPKNSVPNTVIGFSGLAVSQLCVPGGTLSMSIKNTNSYPIEIIAINTTSSTNSSLATNTPFSIVLQSGLSKIFFLNGACPSKPSAFYSADVGVQYLTGNSVNPGPYFSNGTVSGKASTTNSNLAASFNGVNSYISVQNPAGIPSLIHSATVVAWVDPEPVQSDSTYNGILSYGPRQCTGTTVLLSMDNVLAPTMATWCNDYTPTSPVTTSGNFNFVALVINGKSVTLYANGQSTSGTILMPNITSGVLNIGSTDNPGRIFNGSISNVQFYLQVLSPAQISMLYSEGRLGAPVSNESLVGWWPLDGNANDYSGNNNNGVAYNVQWVSP